MNIKLLEGKNLIIILLILSLMAISIPLGAVTWALISKDLGLTQTGQLGDTIGGTAGALINGMGLLLVYSSFKAQLKANELQKQEHDYDLTFQLLEKFLETLSKEPTLFSDLPTLEFAERFGFNVTTGVNPQNLPLGFTELRLRQSQMRQLASYFDLLYERISVLLPAQKQIVSNILISSYSHWLNACFDSYVYNFMGAMTMPNSVTHDQLLGIRGVESASLIINQINAINRLRDN